MQRRTGTSVSVETNSYALSKTQLHKIGKQNRRVIKCEVKYSIKILLICLHHSNDTFYFV